MKITVSIGGPFPSPFRWAEYLERRDSLERMISFMPMWRLESRLGVQLERRHLLTFPWLAYVNFVQWKYFSKRVDFAYSVSELFDRLAADRLGICDVFNGWSLVALHSMRKAKRIGAQTILNTGSAHIVFQKALLEAEFEKFGIQRPLYDSRMVEKGAQEFIEADHIIVASTFVKRTIVGQGIYPEKISIVPDAVTRHFRTVEKRDSVFRIITVGRLEIRKGIQYVLEAVKRLRLPNAELVLVGGPQPEFDSLLRQYAGCYRLAGAVTDEELGLLYSQSSVMVLPSVEDGWSHVTLEAMSCGLPVIVSANAGSADAVQEGVTGFVVPACNPEAIMEKLEFLYTHPEQREAMGQKAKASVRDRTWDMYGQQNWNVFDEVIKNIKA